jgi:hypothetical protein
LRWLALVAGFALVVIAFAAATRVADTREGLVAEIITLFAGLAGVSLLLYGFAARAGLASRPRPAEPKAPASAAAPARTPHTRTRRDLLLGVGGVLLAIVLLTGLGASMGPLWAGFGLALLLPMLAGSVYLCVRFFRSEP